MAAEQGHPAAQSNLGHQYNVGQGVPQDYAEAIKWFRLSAEKGFPGGQTNLGTLYEYGRGVPQDYAEAAKWYGLAAAQGLGFAQYVLGNLYVQGKGVELDYAQAAKLYRGAAEDGIPQAQCSLGIMHLKGDGVERSYENAVKWLQMCAAQGYKEAQEILEMIFDKSKMDPSDYDGSDEYGGDDDCGEFDEEDDYGDDDEDDTWYSKVAVVRSSLGYMHEHGDGAPKDHAQAAEWYYLAADACEEDQERHGALEYYQKAMKIHEGPLSGKHPGIDEAREGLARAYLNVHDYPNALEHHLKAYKKVSEAHKKALRRGSWDSERVIKLQYLCENIGWMYYYEHDYHKGLEYLQKSMENADTALLQGENEAVARRLRGIGFCHLETGYHPGAIDGFLASLTLEMLQRGLEYPDGIEQYDNEHLDDFISIYDTAKGYADQGDYRAAMMWCRKAMEVLEEMTGPKSSHAIVNSFIKAAEAFQEQDDHDEAMFWFLNALEVCHRGFGKGHPSTAGIYNFLAEACANQGDYPAALKWFEYAIESLERVQIEWDVKDLPSFPLEKVLSDIRKSVQELKSADA
jgi:TPR repeat protein